MPVLSFDPLDAFKQKAFAEMMQYFNEVAANSLHVDMALMVAILKGTPIVHPIEYRDARLRETAQKIQDAKSLDEINAALAMMRAPAGPNEPNPNALQTGLSTPVPLPSSPLTE